VSITIEELTINTRIVRGALDLATVGVALTLVSCSGSGDDSQSASPTPMTPLSVDIQPGPAALNNPPPRAPQFENTGIWQADPIWISGASAYRKGEFLYQDYLYDDRGATTNGNAGPTNLARSGRYTYPENVAAYFDNLADIVEVRLKLTSAETAFRVTFNSMGNPALVGTTIAVGGTAGVLRTVPFGANAVEPADVFITVSGNTAVVTDAATGTTLGSVALVTDFERRQVEVRLPFAMYDPRGKTVRVAAAAGLWNAAATAYHVPGATATSTTPGGAGTNVPNPPAFFNVAFRYNEPNPIGSTYTRWRDGIQGSTLAATVAVNGVQTHDLSSFAATVDFVKLASGVDDDMKGTATGVPVSGFINRIVSSAYETMQGIGNPGAADIQLHKPFGCTPTSLRSADGLTSCVPMFAGRLQPYSLFIPTKVPPATGYGLISDLHGGGDNYQRNPPVTAERTVGLAESGTGFLIFITQGRGGRYYWGGQAGADIWEVMADIMRAYTVDRDKIVAGGISQGGNGTWKQVLSFPDVYAAAIPHVPCPSGGTGYTGTNAPGGAGTFAYPMIDSLRNVPVIISAGESDNTCAWNGAMGNMEIRNKLDSLGYRYEYWSFPGMGHQFAMQACNNISGKPCAYTFEQDFLDSLGTLKRAVNPTRVTLATSDSLNEPLFGFNGDHAYWLSNVKVRDPSTYYGKVDVKSYGFGLADPVPNATVKTTKADYALGQDISYHTYNRWTKTLAEPAAITARNEVDVVATNVSNVVIDGVRAKVDCSAKINLQSDGATSVVIHGCLKGDVSLNDAVDCADVVIARSASGERRGEARYDTRMDMDDNGVIDNLDVTAVMGLMAAGTVCQ
jgi:dienelactone hydrolase